MKPIIDGERITGIFEGQNKVVRIQVTPIGIRNDPRDGNIFRGDASSKLDNIGSIVRFFAAGSQNVNVIMSVTSIKAQEIAASHTLNAVIALSSYEIGASLPRLQHIIARAAFQMAFSLIPARQIVIAIAAIQRIVTVLSIEHVIAIAAIQCIVAVLSIEHVIAIAAIKYVVSCPAT